MITDRDAATAEQETAGAVACGRHSSAAVRAKQRYSLEDVFIRVVETSTHAGQDGGGRVKATYMRRILAQTRKELTQILRDRMALALALVLPCILLFLMGTAIALTVGGLPIIVQDFDDSRGVARFRVELSVFVVRFMWCRGPRTCRQSRHSYETERGRR